MYKMVKKIVIYNIFVDSFKYEIYVCLIIIVIFVLNCMI